MRSFPQSSLPRMDLFSGFVAHAEQLSTREDRITLAMHAKMGRALDAGAGSLCLGPCCCGNARSLA